MKKISKPKKKESDVMCCVKIGLAVRVYGRVTKKSIAEACAGALSSGEFDSRVDPEDIMDGYAVEEP